MVEQAVRIHFRWGDDMLVFEHVPAGVCGQCGERSLRPEVYDRMATVAESGGTPKAEITVPVYEYAE
jgi:YgiT-type zinc finger domain-containing protein